MRAAAVSAAVAFAAFLQGCALDPPIRVATGHVAHVLCAETFVAGRDPDVVFSDYIARMPVLDRLAPRLRYAVDRKEETVTASLAGRFSMRAAYAPGRGCTIVHGPGRPAAIRVDEAAGFAPDPLAAPAAPVAGDPRLQAAIARAVDEPGGSIYLDAKAVVVVHDGRIVAERYAPGYGPMTPMLSWSVAKSPMSALVGVLVRQGRLRLDGPAPVAAWADPADPHHAITVEQLVRQTSGQPFGSSNSGFDRSTQMQFLHADTAAFAEAAPFPDRPGARWSYTDANYAIVSQIVRDQTGGSPEAVARFARRELFGPLGMTTMTMEFDEAGTPMGATYMMASARDWARFGWLYANDGVAAGRRILPQGWVDWSAAHTPQSGASYAAGFWTNRSDDVNARRRKAAGAPPDSFFADGNFDQFILVSPKQKLVIAWFGFSQDPQQNVGLARISRLAGEVLAILGSAAPAPEART